MNKVALIILDGWGLGEPLENNAIYTARTPFFDKLWSEYPHTRLQASEEYVGLPAGQMGGSEVGHMTIGAGRIIYQDLPRINRSFLHHHNAESICGIPNFQEFLQKAKTQRTHLIGLVSPGGIHSHEDHLYGLLSVMKEHGCMAPVIHLITDGRDTPPTDGAEIAQRLQKHIETLNYGWIVTICGRFYAMDRDKNMDRTDRAVNLILHSTAERKAVGTTTTDRLQDVFGSSYAEDVTDEFIEPYLVDPSYTGVSPDDILFFFNFRSDRMKQLVSQIHTSITQDRIYTMTQYDATYPFPVIFEKHAVKGTLGEVISEHKLIQLRAAETEKFAHVTYFFNGGVEIQFPHELRSLSKSNVVKHDAMPEMKADEIEHAVEELSEENHPAFILVNFANPDMVGHTGNFKATVKGVETVDRDLKKLCDYLTNNGYTCCITADHGNADIMFDLVTREPHTSHTLARVPFIIYDLHNTEFQSLTLNQEEDRGLAHIAPTIIELMGLPPQHGFFPSLILH